MALWQIITLVWLAFIIGFIFGAWWCSRELDEAPVIKIKDSKMSVKVTSKHMMENL